MCRTRLPIPKRNPEQRQCYVMVTWRCMLRLNSSCLVSRQTSWMSLYRSWRPSRFVRIICPVRCCSWWCPKPPGAKALIGTLLSPWPHNDGCLSAIVSQKEIMVSEMTKSLCGHCRGLGERTIEETVIRRFLETVTDGTDIKFRGSVPLLASGNQKSSIVVGYRWVQQTNKRWLWSEAEMLMGLNIRQLVKFVRKAQCRRSM